MKKINETYILTDLYLCKKNGELCKLLKGLGRLPADFDEQPLLKLLSHQDDKVRCLVVKNLAKLSKYSLIGTFSKLLKTDKSSSVRREAASAIGRLRNPEAKETLFNLLSDQDPEVVLQAIRGLLVFKQDEDVKNRLFELKEHPNEIIKEIIRKELKLNNNTSKDKNHVKSPDYLKNVVVKGDVRETLRLVPDESVHLTFTSPPYYNARDYSIYRSYQEYLDFLESVFKEVHRITKEGRFFLLNTSPIIIPRAGRKYSSKRYPIPYDLHPLLIKMGWDFIDDIVWVKPEASVKNRNAGFYQHRKPLGYKPNACTECVMVYRKKTDKLIDWNIKQYDNEIVDESKVKEDYESTNIWKIDPVFDKIHSAVFPEKLCNNVIKLYSFIGDLVFDPFAGSGTLGKSAKNLKRYFFLTELQQEYVNRIKENVGQNKMTQKNMYEPKFFDIKEFQNVVKNDPDNN